MSGTVPRRRRRSTSVGSEERVREVEELGWRSVWEEARVLRNERRRVMDVQGQTKWVFRVGGGSLPEALTQQREGWLGNIKHNSKMWRIQDKEEKRIEVSLERVRAEKTETERRIKEAEEELETVEGLLGRIGLGREGEWAMAADRPCSCLGACGCLVEVKLVLGEERKELVLQPADGVVTEVVKGEEKSQEVKSQEEEKRDKEELALREHEVLVSEEVRREAQRVEEARNDVIKAQLDMVEKDELIRRCVAAAHWERVDELVNGLRRAWGVMRANEGEGGWPEKWWNMVSCATIARGEAAVALRQWERLLAVVGKYGEGPAKMPRKGEPGWSTEKVARWHLLRARARRHQRQSAAARHDLGTTSFMAGKWPDRQWAKIGYTWGVVRCAVN